MQTYREYRPTAYDVPGLALKDRQTWLVAPVGRNRDSKSLERSNWAVSQELLRAADPQGDTWEIHRFDHWACGWFEIILLAPGSAAAQVGETIERRLANYPYLSEDHHSDMIFGEACDGWESASLRDRITWCARQRISIFAARRGELPQDPQGGLVSYIVDGI